MEMEIFQLRQYQLALNTINFVHSLFDLLVCIIHLKKDCKI